MGTTGGGAAYPGWDRANRLRVTGATLARAGGPTHKSADARKWLRAHPRWQFVFTPNHASWLNQVEIVFAIMCRRLLEHGHFDTPEDLAEQMLAYIEIHNQTAKPFNWTYTGKVLTHDTTHLQDGPLGPLFGGLVGDLEEVGDCLRAVGGCYEPRRARSEHEPGEEPR